MDRRVQARKNAIKIFWCTDHITPAILVQKGHARQKISEITSHSDPKIAFLRYVPKTQTCHVSKDSDHVLSTYPR